MRGTGVTATIFPRNPSSMSSPTDSPPPPPYQMSLEEFDQKTSQAIQLASSTTYPVDEDGWPNYDPAAFEAVVEGYEHPPPSSSSAGIFGTEVRHGRPSPVKVSYSTRPTKVCDLRTCFSPIPSL